MSIAKPVIKRCSLDAVSLSPLHHQPAPPLHLSARYLGWGGSGLGALRVSLNYRALKLVKLKTKMLVYYWIYQVFVCQEQSHLPFLLEEDVEQ